MDALHTGDAQEGLLKAKILAISGAASALVKLWSSYAILEKLRLGFAAFPEFIDGWIYKLGSPRILGIELRELTVRPDTDFVMMAAGGHGQQVLERQCFLAGVSVGRRPAGEQLEHGLIDARDVPLADGDADQRGCEAFRGGMQAAQRVRVEGMRVGIQHRVPVPDHQHAVNVGRADAFQHAGQDHRVESLFFGRGGAPFTVWPERRRSLGGGCRGAGRSRDPDQQGDQAPLDNTRAVCHGRFPHDLTDTLRVAHCRLAFATFRQRWTDSPRAVAPRRAPRAATAQDLRSVVRACYTRHRITHTEARPCPHRLCISSGGPRRLTT